MIFFMIDAKTKDISGLFSAEPVQIKEENMKLISWNDIPTLATFEKLKQVVMEEWKKDECCMDMIKQAKEMYGIDLTFEQCGENGNFDKNTVLEMVEKVFFYWAHPLVGSVGNSRISSPFDEKKEYMWQWHTSDQVISSEETIKRAMDELGPMKESGMEQVKICSNVRELARSIAGEVTTQIARDIEKLFALKLSQSEELYQAQVAMLKTLLEQHKEEIMETVSLGRAKLEAVKNILPKTKFIKPSEMVLLLEEFMNMAMDPQYVSSYTGKLIQYIQVWKKLLPTARCAILMKDVSKLLGPVSIPENISIGSVVRDSYKAYTLIESVDSQKYIPELIVNGAKIGWNRDEYHTSTKTYRHFLCPLWNGGTGETAQVLLFWKNILGDMLPQDGITVIAGGLFLLSNLYSDKYKTAEHTLAEIFEATCVKEISNLEKASVVFNAQNVLQKTTQSEDAFSLLKDSQVKDGFIDPVALSSLIKKVYFDEIKNAANCYFSEAYERVQTAITEECNNIKEVFQGVLPNWNGVDIAWISQEVSTYGKLLSGVKRSLFQKLKMCNQTIRNAIHL